MCRLTDLTVLRFLHAFVNITVKKLSVIHNEELETEGILKMV